METEIMNARSESIWQMVNKASTIAICGHIRPDGDCVGSCMALYMYIKKIYTDKKVYVYLEHIPEVFKYISCINEAILDYRDVKPDLFISLDCSDPERLGAAEEYFKKAPHTINIDHHISNLSFGEINHYSTKSSSTCEVVFELMEDKHIDVEIATALYTGIIHDTGVFRYNNTSRRTMEIGGILIEKGVAHDIIIDESFYEKTYVQNKLLARCVLDSYLELNGDCIVGVVSKAIMDEYGANTEDLDGIVNQLRITKGVRLAVFIHEMSDNEFKVSLRANGKLDVSRIAVSFGGGGHVKAAGCTLYGNLNSQLKILLERIKEEIDNTDE